MAVRQKIGNKNQAVQETENKGKNFIKEGAGGQRREKGDFSFKFCRGCSATGWHSGRSQEPEKTYLRHGMVLLNARN